VSARRDHAILYDDECGFCRFSANAILRLDRDERLRPVAIQSEEGERLLAEVPESERLESWHLITPGGRVVSAGAAAAPLAHVLPVTSIPSRLFSRYPDRTERIYRWIAGHRTLLGRIGLRSKAVADPTASGGDAA
jgi:predicted DCC family thiol-disulfide oxidoreductase YuxK